MYKQWERTIKEVDGEFIIELPDDLLEYADLKVGDQIDWIDNKDGSFTLSKVIPPLDVTNLKDVTRVEVIDAKGRSYTNNYVESLRLSIQDDGRTLKVFIQEGA